MTANPGGGDYRPDLTSRPRPDHGPRCPVCVASAGIPPTNVTPVSVAQDAADATDTPARTPGGSGTAEARTEAQGERKARYARAIFDDQIVSYDPDEVDEVTEAVMAVADAERESATDPGMTNLEAELVALRAEVEQAERHWKQWMDRALTAEADAIRLAGRVAELRAQMVEHRKAMTETGF